MLKRHHRFFQSLLVTRDTLLAGVAFYVAYVVRFSFPEQLPYENISDPTEVRWVGTMVVALWPLVAWGSRLYVSRRARSLVAELFDVTRATTIHFLVLVTLTYFIRDERFSRMILILWASFNVLLVSAGRMMTRVMLRQLRKSGYNLRSVLVVGSGRMAQRVVQTVQQQASMGLRLAGIVSPSLDEATDVEGVPVLGHTEAMQELVRAYDIDQVIVALPIEKLGVLKDVMQVLSRETVDVRLVPDFYQFMTLGGGVEDFSGLPVINLQSSPLLGWNLVLKRAFDIVFALVGLILAAPVIALCAALIRLTTLGPAFFGQERVGMDGRRFRMYKLRTMHVAAEASGARMTQPGDPRCTRLGKILRRFSLDELPQLWNVLLGDMSIVGPRPEQPSFIERFEEEIPRYALRHKIKAGITGWAQINGMRGQTCIAKRLEFDLYYIENWSLLLDLKIMIRTLFGGFLSPNAY